MAFFDKITAAAKSAKESANTAIEVGKPIKVDGSSRAEVADNVKALRQQSDSIVAQSGFIEYDG